MTLYEFEANAIWRSNGSRLYKILFAMELEYNEDLKVPHDRYLPP
jgi:hypothetical protein